MHNIRRVLTQKADFVFTSNPENIRWYLGRKGYNDPEDFKREFESFKPCIHGSDAHELFFVGHPCANRGKEGHNCKASTEDCELRHCWIKADPTFEGLKQVLYEPEERVFIGANDPTRSRYNHTLARIQLNHAEINSHLTMEATNIQLNRGLVAITGGRGAGKTAFVDLIANCFADQVDKQTGDSFVVRIASDTLQLKTTVEFTGADLFTKSVEQKDQVINQADLSYISQGQLDDYIYDDNELSKRIRELLFGAATQVLEYDFNSLFNRTKEIESQIADYSSKVISLENQTSEKVSTELDNQRKRIETELKDLKRQLKEIEETALDMRENEEAKNAQAVLSSLRDKQKNLSKLKEQLANAVEYLDVHIPRLNKAIESINELVEALPFNGNGFARIEYVDKGKLDELTRKVEDAIRETLSAIDAAQEKLNKRNDSVSIHTNLLDKISETEINLNNAVQQSQGLAQLRDRLQLNINSRAESYRKLLETVVGLQSKYLEIIARFKDNGSESTAPLKDLEFLAEIHFDRGAFVEEAEDLFDGRSIDVCSVFSKTLDSLERFADKGDDKSIESLSESIESHVHPNNKELRDKIKPNKSINLDDFFKVFYKNYFRVSSTVTYNQIPLERLSLGQKATVLFKIYLAHGNYPVIIDSHDDYLDNEFIMDELGPAIREAKKRRQVILVSNNANIVVNSDAEQVIVAHYNNGTISYFSGSLEDPRIRTKLLEVLEGGEEAFKKRQDKYRMR